MNDTIDNGATKAATEYLDLYSKYNTSLRTWFVGFGFGFPATLILEDKAVDKLVTAQSLECVVLLFLIGGSAQIFIAWMNKTVNWCGYYGAENKGFKDTSGFKWSDWISKQYWIDIFFDFLTFGVYVRAVYLVFDAYALPLPPTVLPLLP